MRTIILASVLTLLTACTSLNEPIFGRQPVSQSPYYRELRNLDWPNCPYQRGDVVYKKGEASIHATNRWWSRGRYYVVPKCEVGVLPVPDGFERLMTIEAQCSAEQVNCGKPTSIDRAGDTP